MRRAYMKIVVAVLAAAWAVPTTAIAQGSFGTGFTYQGRLTLSGSPVTEACDFQFTLMSDPVTASQVGSPVSALNVPVTEGLFTVVLDFGSSVFDGQARWLEIEVRCPAGLGSFETLAPRQELTPTPYALALPGMRSQPGFAITESPNIIGGTRFNTVLSGASGATIAGGGREAFPNEALSNFSTVGGGLGNIAGGPSATVPGGLFNQAMGETSFAAGRRARALHDGAFVWADDSAPFDNYPSIRANEVRLRADGGVHLDLNAGHWITIRRAVSFPFIDNLITTSTGARLSTGGAWVNSSDVAGKRDFEPIDSREILSGLSRLPLSRWSYKNEDPSVRHIGPTAQDFYAAFGLGQDNTHIGTLDADGIALVSIQALHSMAKDRDSEITRLRDANTALERECRTLSERLAALEEIVAARLAAKPDTLK